MPVYRVKLEDSWLVEAESEEDAIYAMEAHFRNNRGYEPDLDGAGEVDDEPRLRINADGEAYWVD